MDTSTAPASPSAADRPCAIRPLRSGDGLEVRRIFRETIVLGHPLSLQYPDIISYERLCLDWYLTAGATHARVVEQDGTVVGYLLACLDQPAYEAWVRRRAVRWAARSLWRLAMGGLGPDARRFVRLRIEDGFAGWREAPTPPFPAHAHLNLDARVRDAGIGHRLTTEMDDMVEAAGYDGWFGEVNVPAGGSLDALEREGAVVVHRMPNRTFSWLVGTQVHRATVARALDARPHRLSAVVP